MKIASITTLALLVATTWSATNAAESRISFREMNLPFEMPDIELPVIPAKDFRITDFGAAGDGLTDNTAAFAAAIDEASRQGGGRIIVPQGLWLTGPILFKSHIELHVVHGAIVLFTPDKSKYPIIKTIYEGYEHARHTSPLHADGVTDIAITGGGLFDGNGEVWRQLKRDQLTESEWKRKTSRGGLLSDDGKYWYPSENFKKGYEARAPGTFPPFPVEEISDFLRPVMVKIIRCQRVLFDGPSFYNSPAWNIHPVLTEHLVIRNIRVKNHDWATNGDALDIESCRCVLVEENMLSAGDDALCLKSGRDEDGRRRGMPTEKVVIRRNMIFQGHGGVVIGSEMSGSVRDIYAADCQFSATDTGLRFKTARGRGGVVENIWIERIAMTDIAKAAVTVSMFYHGKPQEKSDLRPEGIAEPVTEGTPVFRNIHLSDIRCSGADVAIEIDGLAESRLEKMTIERSSLHTGRLWRCSNAAQLTLRDVKFKSSSDKPMFEFFDASDIVCERVEVQGKTPLRIEVAGPRSSNIVFTQGLAGTNPRVNFTEGASKEALVMRQ